MIAMGGGGFAISSREVCTMNYSQYKQSVGAYAADVHVAAMRARQYSMAVALGWVVFPFAVQTVLHPSDAIRLQLRLQGQPVPHLFTAQQAASGLVEAVFALAVLVLLQMVCTVLFYRRAKLEGSSVATPALWPIAALSVGVIGNGVWWYATGVFDPSGGLVGWSSMALTFGGEMLCNKLGRDFVLGSGTVAAPYVEGGFFNP
jgi:hypothetical protein